MRPPVGLERTQLPDQDIHFGGLRGETGCRTGEAGSQRKRDNLSHGSNALIADNSPACSAATGPLILWPPLDPEYPPRDNSYGTRTGNRTKGTRSPRMPRRKRAIAGLMLAVAAVMFSGIAGAQVIVRPWYRPY